MHVHYFCFAALIFSVFYFSSKKGAVEVNLNDWTIAEQHAFIYYISLHHCALLSRCCSYPMSRQPCPRTSHRSLWEAVVQSSRQHPRWWRDAGELDQSTTTDGKNTGESLSWHDLSQQADSVFSGITTFGRLPYVPCLHAKDEKYDIAFLGTTLHPYIPHPHQFPLTVHSHWSRRPLRHRNILPARRTLRPLRNPPRFPPPKPVVRSSNPHSLTPSLFLRRQAHAKSASAAATTYP